MGEQVRRRILKGADLSLLIGRLTTKAFVPLIAVTIFAIVQLLRFGFTGDYLFLLFGSILSVAALWGYVFMASNTTKEGSIKHMLIPYPGFLPYLLGCYLVFYRGFWRLSDLALGFSISTMLKAACFVLVGYAIVSGTYKVSGFWKKS